MDPVAAMKRMLLNKLPDCIFIPIWYKRKMGKTLDLKNPRTLNEKLQWLKLNDRREFYTLLADKFQVRSFVSEKIGDQYLVECLGVWDRFSDINFDELPNQFVLKTTHDSGGVVLCRDKTSFDYTAAKNILEKSLKRNYYYSAREYQYKNIQPRIIAEELLVDSEGNPPADYKVMCFNGIADNVMVCTDRHAAGGVNYFYFDVEWKPLLYMKETSQSTLVSDIKKPECLDELIRVSEILSTDLPIARIDLYITESGVKFSEITLCPDAGIDTGITEEADLAMGLKLVLPKRDKK